MANRAGTVSINLKQRQKHDYGKIPYIEQRNILLEPVMNPNASNKYRRNSYVNWYVIIFYNGIAGQFFSGYLCFHNCLVEILKIRRMF